MHTRKAPREGEGASWGLLQRGSSCGSVLLAGLILLGVVCIEHCWKMVLSFGQALVLKASVSFLVNPGHDKDKVQ